MSYELRKAVRAVHLVDTFKDRQDLFDYYVSRHFIARAVLWCYGKIKNTPLSALMFTCFGMRYLLKHTFADSVRFNLSCPIDYVNERRAILDFLGRVDDSLNNDPSSRRSAAVRRQLGLLMREPGLIFRFAKFFRRYEPQGTFLTCCRVSELLWCYVCAEAHLEATSAKGVLVATNYAPTACALMAAARDRKLKVVYTCHAIIPYDAVMPALEADIAYLYSKRAIEAFNSYYGIECRHIHFTGLAGPSRPMRLAESFQDVKTVGVFLTAYTVQPEFERLIRELSEVSHIQSIIIRPHPLAEANPDLAFISAFPKVTLETAGRAYDTAAKSDFVIAGSSSVHIEVVKSGTPSLYWERFDTIGPDYYRFLRDGVLYPLDDVGTLDWNAVKEFYSSSWIDRFRELDCSYMHDPLEMNLEMKAVLERLMSGEFEESLEPAPRRRVAPMVLGAQSTAANQT